MKKRKSFEAGHRRKFLLIIDESQEVDAALFYTASRISHSSGSVLMLYVVEPQQFQHWINVREAQLEEETAKAKAMFRLARRKLNQAGFEDIASEEVIREGVKSEEIIKMIDEDEDVAILVLGAATESEGPGPLVSSLAAGEAAGKFPIPITIVPGNLDIEEIMALA
ncbi:MAG: universal stress protein [Alphaproteobacteria bacterium]|nr:universal stress protein [Alphaproteobacteria bacterium]